ncbi:hypothetical protein BASA81_001998 [Batrachochytrium salamandrivorans]|nr:hypothetical protein BASA81_001998 [Batrachochytrium salamandrivorans]
MSDDEYAYSDDGNDAFDYGSDAMEEGGESDEKIQLENTFYEAEECKNQNPAKSLELFEQVVEMEKQYLEGKEVRWRWKALEQIVLLRSRLNKPVNAIVGAFAELLSHMNQVTPKEVNDSINSILDDASTLNSNLDSLYEIALDKLKSTSNERLWFSANLKRGKAFLQRKEYARLEQVVSELKQSPSILNELDINRGTYQLEVYALEIAMYGGQGNKQKMREAYSKTQALSAAIQDPRIMGGIHFTGGKMLMEEGRFQEAYDEFFSGFRHMQEAGDAKAKQSLKLVVLCNMLAISAINPFDSREAKVYQNDEEIKSMLALRSAYEENDIIKFDLVLKDPKSGIASDEFISRFTAPLLNQIRANTLQEIVRPYNRIRLPFLAKEIGVSEDAVEELVAQLILDGKIGAGARIDQQRGVLELKPVSNGTTANGGNNKKYFTELESWAATAGNLAKELNARVALAHSSTSARAGGGEIFS